MKKDRNKSSPIVWVLFGWILLVLIIPFVWLDSYDDVNYSHSLTSPSLRHPLGTDLIGRDLFVRVLVGAQISLLVAVLSRLVALILGILLGGAAGILGGWWDLVLMRVVDVMLAFPTLLLAVALVTLLGPSLMTLFIALGIASCAEIARLMRAQVLLVKTLDFTMAATSIGGGKTRIFLVHVLPNCLNPVLVWTTTGMAGAILAEAGLAFLGLGVEPPMPSWGALIAQGWDEIQRAPWLTLFPGLALATTVFLFNRVGDLWRESLDPLQRSTSIG